MLPLIAQNRFGSSLSSTLNSMLFEHFMKKTQVHFLTVFNNFLKSKTILLTHCWGYETPLSWDHFTIKKGFIFKCWWALSYEQCDWHILGNRSNKWNIFYYRFTYSTGFGGVLKFEIHLCPSVCIISSSDKTGTCTDFLCDNLQCKVNIIT